MATTTTVAETVEAGYRKWDFTVLRQVYAPDVILDVNVPMWRFQLQGADTVVGWFQQQAQAWTNPRVTWSRTVAGDGCAVIEWEMRGGEGDTEEMCRQADILHIRDGRVVEHHLFCTGKLDAQTIARQKQEAPMVRP